MNNEGIRHFSASGSILTAALLLTPALALSQANLVPPSSNQGTNSANASAKQDRWLHVRVDKPEAKDEAVRINVPLELAEKVLPTINQDRLQRGKVKLNRLDCQGVDLNARLDAVRSTKDGEFVTVQSKDADVRVAKQGSYFLVHVLDKSRPKKSQVEVKVPMKVVDALLSGGKDELDLVAGLHALSLQGDTELVSVKDAQNTVRVWLDSRSAMD